MISYFSHELWLMIAHPFIYLRRWWYKNASSSELRQLPFKQLFNITMNQTELNSWNKMAAVLDFAFPVSDINKFAEYDIHTNPKEHEKLKYCVKYAAYAYFMPIIGNPSSLQIMDKHVPLITMKPAEPGYFIAIDEDHKRVLLCIRGTTTFGDIRTDLDAKPEQRSFHTKQYVVHQGIYDAARWIDAQTRPKILNYLQQKSDYAVLITGHSLGAGVCSLLSLLWNNDPEIDNDKFSYYSFASPLVIDCDGVKECNSYNNLISIAVSSDIVTRMSVESLIEMNKRVEMIEQTPNHCKYINNIIKQIVSAKPLNELEPSEWKLIQDLRCCTVRDESLVLYPCGRVLWFVPEFLTDRAHDIGDKYSKLLHLVDEQTTNNVFTQIWQFIRNIIADINGCDDNERLIELSSASDMKWFTNMIYNGAESFNAHLPGQYTNGFNINIVDIFKMSPSFNTLQSMVFASFMESILFFAMIILVVLIGTTVHIINDVLSFFF